MYAILDRAVGACVGDRASTHVDDAITTLPDCIVRNLIVCYFSEVESSDPFDMLRLDQQLCFAMYSTSLAMTKLYKPLLAPLGLTYPQYLVMLALWENDGLTVSQTGDRLMLDSGTLTPLLKRLEEAGRLRRTRDVADERRVIVTLTKAGHALKKNAVAIPPDVMCATACQIEELRALTAQLNALRANLTEFTSTLRT